VLKKEPRRPARLGALAAILVLAVLGIALMPSTVTHLKTGGLAADSSESVRADALLKKHFPAATPDIVLVLTPGAGGRAGAVRTVEAVARLPHVTAVHSYFSDTPVPELATADGRAGLAFVSAPGVGAPADLIKIVDGAREAGQRYGVGVTAGGDGVIDGAIDKLAEESLVRSELIAAPVVAVILLIVFGSVWAAAMPLLAGGAAVAIAMALLHVLARLTDVSTFAINLATALGFGLAIDYSLFIVSRWRECRAQGMSPQQSRRTTLRTSGRTIAFSGITVVIVMAALLVFPGYFLKSLAYSGIITIATVMAVTLFVVPWMLEVVGERALRRYRWSRWAAVEYDPDAQAPRNPPSGTRTWAGAVLITGLLIGAAAPFLHANFIARDYRELPANDPARHGTEALITQFPALAQNSASVAFPDGAPRAELDATARRLAQIPDVESVRWSGGQATRSTTIPPSPFDAAMFGTGSGPTWIQANLAVAAESERAADAVRAIRTEVGGEALVGGPTAGLVDINDGLTSRLPYAVVAIVVVTALLLFLLTGSVVLPVIGVALSVLSLGATFGSLVFIFQEGHLRELLGGFTAFGAINVTAPILLFCIAYGLSMDYQMFILARIAEEYAGGRSSADAVAIGMAATRRVIGAAAVLIGIVLAALAASQLTYLKILGVGLATAIVVDAFIVRLFLLPNVMRIVGDAAWYRPRWLDPVYERLKVSH